MPGGNSGTKQTSPGICVEETCGGVQAKNGRCLAHLRSEDLEAKLEELRQGGVLDARGVILEPDLIALVLEAFPLKRKRPQISEVSFDWAAFVGDADFERAAFLGPATFQHTTFRSSASFREATFKDFAGFYGARFEGDADFQATRFTRAVFYEAAFLEAAGFDEARFTDSAVFQAASFRDYAGFAEARLKRADFGSGAGIGGAKFEGWAEFTGATFTGDASFREVTFGGLANFASTFRDEADFSAAVFENDADFAGALFSRGGIFSRARFMETTDFASATFGGNADFEEALCRGSRQLGPLVVSETVILDGAAFEQPVEIAVSARRLQADRVQLLAGGQVRVRGAEISFAEAQLAEPTVVTGEPVPSIATSSRLGIHEAVPPEAPASTSSQSVQRARLLSLRRADVAGLVLSAVDLRPCRFVGAHHLDGLRMEGGTEFGSTPPGWHTGKVWPPLWRWSHRKAIAEEHLWRVAQSRDQGWGVPEPYPEALGAVPEAADVAAVYRALRKGREDSKDEPGAADFYYGEMEMRRHDDTVPLAERVIILLYWLVSGYGLRASRALTALVVTILVFGVLFYQWGFPSHVSLGESLTFSAQSTTSLFRAPERQLTLVGNWFEIALRLLGPLFFGLALLSLRGRVRR